MKEAKTTNSKNIVSRVINSMKENKLDTESNTVSEGDKIIEVISLSSRKDNLIRIDKNIANNIDVLTENHDKTKGLSNEDKNLIKNLIYFMCFKRQTDIFGFGELDPHEFAELFGYNHSTFWKKHQNPIQLDGLSHEEKESFYKLEQEDLRHHIFDSIFENALYWLHTNVLRFKRAAKDVIIDKETVSFVESKSYVLLPELKLTVRRKGKNEKYFYSYSVDKNFIANLSLYYLNCNKQSLIALRQSSLDDLYLFLSNMRASIVEKLRNTKEESYYGSIDFEFLCTLAQIKKFTKSDPEHNNPPKEVPAKKRKQLLITALNKINEKTELKFEVSWQKKKPTDRWDYYPIINFMITREETITSPKNHELIEEKHEIFRQNLGHELWDVYKFIGTATKANFFDWLNDNSKDLKEKEMAYRYANLKTYGKSYTYIDMAINSWLKKLPTITSMENIDGGY